MPIELKLAGECNDPRTICTECSHCGKLYKFEVGCDKRFAIQCPVCSYKWMKRTRNKYTEALTNMRNPKLMTLTLLKNKETGNLLKDDIREIWQMKNKLFHALAKRKYRIRSWFAVVELPNHLHLVYDGDFVPQKELSKLWKKASAGSFIVDIRAVKNYRPGFVAIYLTKYLTKGCIEYRIDIERLKSFRMVGSWKLIFEKIKFKCKCEQGKLMMINETAWEFAALREKIEGKDDYGIA